MNSHFPGALLLAFLSGAAALAHQILWTRRLVDVLGASADTFSKVVGAFFIGLALGAWLASRTDERQCSFWMRVALAELGVAILAVPALLSPALTEWLARGATSGGWLKWLLPPLLVTPPAVAMGLVIPWMTRALASRDASSSRRVVWLYAVNTLGGVGGIAFIVLFGLPGIGLNGASAGAIGANVVVAAGASLLAAARTRRRQKDASPFQPAVLGSQSSPGSSPLTHIAAKASMPLLAFASGFLVLALEVALQHQLAQVTINSLFSSALVLVLVLVSLTVGAMLLPVLIRLSGDEQRAMAWALVISALLCAGQPLLLTGLRDGVNILPYELPPFPYFLEVAGLGAVAVCPMLVASGLVFPLLLRRAAAVEGGLPVGVLLAWNGLGGWLGAELAQAVLSPVFGLWQSMVVAAAGYAALWFYATRNAAFTPGDMALPKRRTRVANAIVLLVVLVAGGWFARLLPQATVGSTERLHAFRVGREGAVAVVESGPDDWRMLFNNSYTLGGSKAQFNQERQGLLPLLLHGQAKSVATLGVATGSTAAGVALSPRVERLDAIELSPLVLMYAETFFAPYNRKVFGDPRARFLAEDARWVMAREHAAYDVVVGDLFLPWRTGEGRLFTREHFQNVKRALKPGGVFCQWLPLFQLTRPQFEAIARTFREVFPDTFLVRGDFYSELPILGLVGGKDFRQLDWPGIESACAELRAAGKTTDPLLRHADGVAMQLIGPLPDPPPGPVNTLANAWLEWDAGRNILGLQTPWHIGVPLAEYIRNVQRASAPLLPERQRPAHETGQFFLTLEVAAKLNLPVLEELKAQIPDRLPAPMRTDPGADWLHWPMRVKPTTDMFPGAAVQ